MGGRKTLEIEKRYGIVKAEELQGDLLVAHVVTKNEIELKATYKIIQQINEFKKAGVTAKNSLSVEFWGYDYDEREVFEIPEIRMFIREVYNQIPELFYFLSIDNYTFAIFVNSIFTNEKEVECADQAILDYAKKIGDSGKVITIDYYSKHQVDFH